MKEELVNQKIFGLRKRGGGLLFLKMMKGVPHRDAVKQRRKEVLGHCEIISDIRET